MERLVSESSLVMPATVPVLVPVPGDFCCSLLFITVALFFEIHGGDCLAIFMLVVAVALADVFQLQLELPGSDY